MLPRCAVSYAADVPTIRDATIADLPVIVSLLNVAVVESTAVYSEDVIAVDDRVPWFETKQRRGFPLLVAEVDSGVVGFATYGDFRDSVALPGYRFTVEHSVHVARGLWGGGIGRALVAELMARARRAGVHVMVGAIDAENEASIRFHERLGFVETARMPQVGWKFGRWLDLVLMQRAID
jgi:phosphinothricin acetyltransferase